MRVNKRKISIQSLTASFVIVFFLSSTFLFSNAQTDKILQKTDRFEIPENQGAISFSTNGTYEDAYLQNGTWTWVNLTLVDSQESEVFNLKISAKNSNVTILSLNLFNTTYEGARLSYSVQGHGTQSFNLGVSLEKGEWTVTFNGNVAGQNQGWKVSPNNTVTITEATENATISYYNIPDQFGNPDNSTQNFYQQHSVAITTVVAILCVFCVAILVKWKNKNHDIIGEKRHLTHKNFARLWLRVKNAC